MNSIDFQWEERIGRGSDDEPFHEWTYQHASGRILAAILGPSDKRGGFSHAAQFFFHQEVTMVGGPFIFVDFDSAKRYVEAVVSGKVEQMHPDGSLIVVPQAHPFGAVFSDAMTNAAKMMSEKLHPPTIEG
jgi:hypothetical protein